MMLEGCGKDVAPPGEVGGWKRDLQGAQRGREKPSLGLEGTEVEGRREDEGFSTELRRRGVDTVDVCNQQTPN